VTSEISSAYDLHTDAIVSGCAGTAARWHYLRRRRLSAAAAAAARTVAAEAATEGGAGQIV